MILSKMWKYRLLLAVWATVVGLGLVGIFSHTGRAQNVSPMPWLKMQYFDNNGRVCSGCLLYTYQAGTSTPQVTCQDAGGMTPNSNPVVGDASGRMLVFLSSSAYKFVLTTSTGQQLWTIDNITSSVLALLASNNVWTGTNTFNAAFVTNSSATFNAGITSTGPNLLSGGGTLAGTWTGSPTFAGTPNFPNGFTATTGTFSGQITSTLATGTPPFVIASTTEVVNLNAAMLEGCTWEVPCPLGSTTPNTVAATTMSSTGDITDGGQSANAGKCAQYGTAGIFNAASLPCGGPAVAALTTKLLGGNVDLPASTSETIDTQAVTMPAAGCPCRVQISYSYFWAFVSGGGAINVGIYVNDGSNNYANSQAGDVSTSGAAGGQAATQTTATYANGATVTFTVHGESPQHMTILKNGTTVTSMQSFLELKVEQSQ